MDTAEPIAITDIEAAQRRIEGQALRTPLLESTRINEMAGGRVLLKPECLQRTGSFKFRGAWNRISQLAADKCKAGVVAYSSGNHAQGVAAAARLRGMPAVIVMPGDTPDIKKANTRWLGAEIVEYDRTTEDRKQIAEDIARERGAEIVPPYDHRDIIAGQGTVGLEIAENLVRSGITADAAVVPAGGGGLIAGVSMALTERHKGIAVFSAEPAGFDDHARSLAAGKRVSNERTGGSICDALLAPEPGELTFAITSRRLSGGLVVSDAEAGRAVAEAFSHLKLVVEPGGAVALASVLTGKLDCTGKTVVVVLSGGNVDPALYCDLLASEGSSSPR